MSRIYITTAIPFVNSTPHLGHALELVQVDALARAWRRAGHDVRSLTGTDDNALENVRAANEAGVDVAEFVRTNGDRFVELASELDTTFDDVIRTSSDPRHRPGVERLWRACAASDDLYVKDYEGLYCVGCEAFLASDELIGGRCSEHFTAPEHVAESNWFFRLSRYGPRLKAAIDSGELRIEPPSRRNEVLATIRDGLHDISVSRSVEHARGWGIPVPDDPTQIVYVWFDALANYLTALGKGDDERVWWHEADERIHVVGKGIVRFHALYWPAILASAGLALPTALFVHDYLTVDGAKISKTAGNGLDPIALAHTFGVDAVRWWLLSESPLGSDADFTTARLIARTDSDLANGFGNLVSRVVALVHRLRHGEVRLPPDDTDRDVTELGQFIDTFDLRAATGHVRAIVDSVNGELERVRPWERAKHDPADPEIDLVLGRAVHRCRRLADLLAPFAPGVAARARRTLGDGCRVGQPERIQPRLVPRAG